MKLMQYEKMQRFLVRAHYPDLIEDWIVIAENYLQALQTLETGEGIVEHMPKRLSKHDIADRITAEIYIQPV